MSDKKYYVYCHENIHNGKKYIGITMQLPKNRWKNGKAYMNNVYFTRAINKYGWKEGFNHIILFSNISKELAEIIEVQLIKKYKSYDKNFGYNIKLGGNVKGCYSDETKRKISNSKKGITLNESQIIALNKSRRRTEVVQLNIDGSLVCYHKSILSACSNNNWDTKPIRDCCRMLRHTAYGYIWMNKSDYEKWNGDMSFYEGYGSRTKSKPVVQVDKESHNIIGVFSNAGEVEKILGFKNQNVNNCCNKKQKTCGGYLWYFQNEYNENVF